MERTDTIHVIKHPALYIKSRHLDIKPNDGLMVNKYIACPNNGAIDTGFLE
jgi:hypothetical protein